MHFHILTLFPDMVMQGLSQSIIGRAAEQGYLTIDAINIRDYTLDKHKKVDDYPYGGGAGMLMQAQPVYDAWRAVVAQIAARAQESGKTHPRTVYVTPQGKVFHQELAKELAKEEDVIFLCGHYEGIDERVLEEIVTDSISIGDYVLTGGELPAMVMIDAISRMVPGVLSNGESGETESFEGDLLEYPQYSRPEVWNGKAVPDILLSGNQKRIAEWRREEAVKRTKERRPDLYQRYEKARECLASLRGQKLLHMDMIELIERGQAKLLFADENGVCLLDKVSGIYFHTATDIKTGYRIFDVIRQDASARAAEIESVVLHQKFMVEPVKKELGLKKTFTCSQVVYTRREKLPITGKYRLDGRTEAGLPQIRALSEEDIPVVVANYEIGGPSYVAERIGRREMYGAFVEGRLAAFIGVHTEGSIGMLFVLPEYRGRGLGLALETYMINRHLERGYTPFGQVVVGNESSKRLQEALGLYFSGEYLYWMERPKHPEKL